MIESSLRLLFIAKRIKAVLMYWTSHILPAADCSLTVSVCLPSKVDRPLKNRRRMAFSAEITIEIP